ncbi:MAG TPA: hypothetical protein VFT22_02430 [Kofleriaceae bacterium]|nr:hypothetical protein [Kofleriaceae bacterium]
MSLLAACRGSNDNNNGNNSGMPDAPPAADNTLRTIQDVQNKDTPKGAAVELKGVVVTAVDKFGTRNGSLWVEDPNGGPFSGVTVFGAPLAMVTDLQPGDIVDITGAAKSEFAINGDTLGSLTELVAAKTGSLMITKTGHGDVPAPAVVDALAIGMMDSDTLRRDAWEQWEGVLITVNNVAAGDAPSCIKSKGVCTDVDSFHLTGVIQVESGLAAFPAPAIEGGACFQRITGIVDYAFNYVLYPRSTDEIVTGGSACQQENVLVSATACTDGADNDGDSFKDCADFDCQVGPGAWLGTSCAATDVMCGCSVNLPTAGVNKINTGATGTSGPVAVHDVIVTAVATNGFWIADAAQAAASGGIFCFTKTAPVTTPDGTPITVGMKLGTVQGLGTVVGTSALKLTEINRATGRDASTGTDPLPITGIAATQLTDGTMGAPFTGSLVQLGPLKVTKVADAKNRIELTDNSGAHILMDDGAFVNFGGATGVADIPLDRCFKTLTGVMDLAVDDQLRTINPRSDADMVQGVTGTDCN